MWMEILGVFLFGLITSWALVRGAMMVFPKLGLLDFPKRYGLSRSRLPYPGGLVIALSIFLIAWLDARFWGLFLPILLLGMVSFWDDRKNLPIFPRAFIHFLAATWMFYAGIKITWLGDPFNATNVLLPVWFSYLVTIIWIIGVQNAMNWFDGLKGLCPGIAGIGFFFLGILGVVRPELFFDPAEQSIILANFLLAGLCFGGWWYFFRGKILLGDTGSQVLGFLLATMAIFSGAKIGTTLLVLALPILDTVFVVLRRILVDKKSPFKGDLKHVHHNLSRRAGEPNAVLLLLFISLVLGMVSVTMVGFSKFVAVSIATVLIGFFILWAGSQKRK